MRHHQINATLFYSYYLIEDILIFSLENTIQKFKDRKIYVRSLREKISKFETEKDRILLLMAWCEHDNTILHERCDNFLVSKGRPSFTFPESLYAFRNFIVHDFRHIADDMEIIKNVNYQLELLILDLLTTYSHKE